MLDDWIAILRKNIAVTALSLLGIVGFFVSVQLLIGRITSLPDLIETVGTRQQQTDALQTKYAILEITNEQNMRTLFTDSLSALPQDKDAGGILVAIEQLTAQNSLTTSLIDLTPGLVSTESAAQATQDTQTAIPQVEALKFLVETKGTFDDTLEFLKKIYTVQRLFGVESVSIEFADDTQIISRITVLAYYSLPALTDFLPEEPIEELSVAELNTFVEVTNYQNVSNIVTGKTRESDQYRFDYFRPIDAPIEFESSPSAEES